MKETQEIWEILKSNKYQVIISDLVFREIGECNDKKRKTLLSYLKEIDYEEYEVSIEVDELAKAIVMKEY